MKKLILFMAALFIGEAQAQTITNYHTADGLVSDAINCVAVANSNQLWVGTNDGVSVYDGSTWISYTMMDGLIDDNVKTIAASGSDVWLGTDFGLSHFDGASFTNYTTADGLAINQVADIAIAPNGDLWFAHASFSAGVTHYDGSNWTAYGSPDLPISGVNATAFDSNGDVWFSSPLDGVVHFDGSSFTNYKAIDGLLTNNTNDIFCVGNEKWIGSYDGLTVLDASNSNYSYHTIMYVLPPPDTLNPVMEIARDGHGTVWAAIFVDYLGEGGVAAYDGAAWLDYDVSDGLAGPNVRDLAIDAQNNVWVATSTGLSKIEGTPSAIQESSDKLFTLYPNPATNHLFVNTAGEKVCYSLMGEEVLRSQEQQLNVSELAAGVYYLRSEEGVAKFVKQ
jgi:ligand-binding sensor domain-containing protein